MSLYDYKESQVIESKDYPFYALIMAAMRKADSTNQAILQQAYPRLWRELVDRYNAPGGVLSSDSP